MKKKKGEKNKAHSVSKALAISLIIAVVSYFGIGLMMNNSFKSLVGFGDMITGMATGSTGTSQQPTSAQTPTAGSKSPVLVPHNDNPVIGYYDPTGNGQFFQNGEIVKTNDKFNGNYFEISKNGQYKPVTIEDGKVLEAEPEKLTNDQLGSMMHKSGLNVVKDSATGQTSALSGKDGANVVTMDSSGKLDGGKYVVKFVENGKDNYYVYDPANGGAKGDRIDASVVSQMKGKAAGGTTTVTGKEEGAKPTTVQTDVKGNYWTKGDDGKMYQSTLTGNELKYKDASGTDVTKKLTRSEMNNLRNSKYSAAEVNKFEQQRIDKVESKSFDLLWSALGESVVQPAIKEFCKSEYKASNTPSDTATDITDTPNPFTTTTTVPGGAQGGQNVGGGVALTGNPNVDGSAASVMGGADLAGGLTNYNTNDPNSMPPIPASRVDMCISPYSIVNTQIEGTPGSYVVYYTITDCSIDTMEYEIYVKSGTDMAKIHSDSIKKGASVSNKIDVPQQNIEESCIKTNDPTVGTNGVFCAPNNAWTVGTTTTTTTSTTLSNTTTSTTSTSTTTFTSTTTTQT